jgi:hypothetical protein
VKQTVAPGKQLDIPTLGEVAELLGGLLGGQSDSAPAVRGEASKATDASGNVIVPCYTVPAGMAFRLTRLYVKPDSATFGAQFTGAGAYLLILRNDIEVDGLSLVAGSVGGGALPVSWSEGITSAPYYMNGDQLQVQLIAGPASTGLLVRFQGELIDLPNR